jgi:hypothetical protein
MTQQFEKSQEADAPAAEAAATTCFPDLRHVARGQPYATYEVQVVVASS